MMNNSCKDTLLNYFRGLETYQLYEMIRIIHGVIEEKIADEYDVVKTNYSINLVKKSK